MKTLCVKQPWASLICTGIKDVENRNWKPKTAPGRILIMSSAAKVPEDYTGQIALDMLAELNNHIFYGNFTDPLQSPTSAIVGYVTVTGFEQETDSVWDGGPTQIKWMLEDAWMFDEPITGVRGQLGLFEYPLDEDKLPPAHKVSIRMPEYEDGVLRVPVNREVFESVASAEGEPLTAFELAVTPELGDMLISDDNHLNPVSSLVLLSPTGDTCSYKVHDPDMFCETYEGTDKPVKELSVYGEELVYPIWSILADPDSKEVFRIPHTLEEAYAALDTYLSDEDRSAMLSMDRDGFLCEQHFGIAMWIRGAFDLFRNEKLCEAVSLEIGDLDSELDLFPDVDGLRRLKPCYSPDSISAELLGMYYDRCKGERAAE